MKHKILQVVFDCDGVLLESSNIKTEAFKILTQPFGEEAQEKFLNYHEKHEGVSRIEKFKWFYSEVLKIHPTEEVISQHATEFSFLIKEKLMLCPMVSGALEALQFLYGKIPLYVCSGTPQNELENILFMRDLSKFFTGIYGTPPEKKILLSKIVEKSDISPFHTLMVGDAKTDLDAALFVGTQFYGRGSTFKDDNVLWAEDLTEIISILNLSI